MTRQLCECGYEAADHLAFQDHLQESFVPRDGKAPDGIIHDEASTGLACLCGFPGSSASDLDRHFLAIFTPASHIGHDGQRHAAAAGPD